jgi:hypothetical protein
MNKINDLNLINGKEYLEKVRKMRCLVCGRQGEPHHLKKFGIGRTM